MADENGSSLGKTNDDFIKFDYSDKHKADKNRFKSKREIKQILKNKTNSSIRPNNNLGPDADTGSPDTGPWDEHQVEGTTGASNKMIELGDAEKSYGGSSNILSGAGKGMSEIFSKMASTAALSAVSGKMLKDAMPRPVLPKENITINPSDIDPRGPLGHSEDDPYSND